MTRQDHQDLVSLVGRLRRQGQWLPKGAFLYIPAFLSSGRCAVFVFLCQLPLPSLLGTRGHSLHSRRSRGLENPKAVLVGHSLHSLHFPVLKRNPEFNNADYATYNCREEKQPLRNQRRYRIQPAARCWAATTFCACWTLTTLVSVTNAKFAEKHAIVAPRSWFKVKAGSR